MANKRWTLEEFHRLCTIPEFENRRTILVDGEILELPDSSPSQDIATGQMAETLRSVFGDDCWVRIRMSLILGAATNPFPALAVVPGPRRQYASDHPTSALLVGEVSESTLLFDIGDKANLYAAGGIADYWVVDLNNRCLHVFRDPLADPAEVFGFRYATHITLASADTVTPLNAPQATITVADLLP